MKRDIKELINYIRHSRVIKDPFPEHSEYERTYGYFSYKEPPEEISIHEAHQKGYDKAYEEILKELEGIQVETK